MILVRESDVDDIEQFLLSIWTDRFTRPDVDRANELLVRLRSARGGYREERDAVQKP